MSDFYRAFEERYYAPQHVIKQLRQQYLPFVQPLATIYPNCQTFDLGCGRGEWLEIMMEIGLKPFGMDIDDGMLKACVEKNLPAEKGDAVKYLNNLTSESQVVISAFHVVEHITFPDLQTVVSEALRVLKPGGLLIMETPNPENLTVATRNFYLDPTHQRPIPAPLLSFVAEFYGFSKVKVIRLQEDKALANKAWPSLQDVLVGASPDYAVVAQKLADDKLLAQTSEAFTPEYGLTLDTLVAKLDQQTIQFDARLSRAETQAQQAADRASHAETQAQQAADHASQAQLALVAIYQSTSWRMTKPFRFFGQKIKLFLSHARLYINRRHTLRKLILALLYLMPSLKRRIQRLSPAPQSLQTKSTQANLADRSSVEFINLSPRAQKIYQDLKASIDSCQKESL